MLKRLLIAALEWMFGDRCMKGTFGCWGRCERCILARIAEEHRERQE